MVGVIPQVIEQRTGLTACNIAEVAGVQSINGMAVTDAYLQHNQRPKYIVFLYAPEKLDRAEGAGPRLANTKVCITRCAFCPRNMCCTCC